MAAVQAAAPIALHNFRLSVADAGWALLSDPAFQASWARLEALCPWSTVCQGSAFANAWFGVYGAQFQPLLVHACDSTGALSGLLVLAHDPVSRRIVHVGAQQAEYQVWLARPGSDEAFVEAAFDALAQRFPGSRLVLQFLPPHVPLGFRRRGGRWAQRTLVLDTPLPMLKLGAESHVEASLRKKKNKSRLSALQRRGPVRLVELRSRAELEVVIDRVAEHYDFRQAALSGAMPFRDDPRKRSFLLALMDQPGLLSAAVLMVGEEVAAANFGLIDGKTVGLGVLAHSPFFAEHSPGKLLVLLLARELGRAGYERIDLTPGGAYKFRFADYRDTAHILEVYFDRSESLQRNLRKHAVNAAKRALTLVNLDPDEVKTRALTLRQALLAGGVTRIYRNLSQLLAAAIRRPEVLVYALDRADAQRIARRTALHLDCLDDLLTYRQRAPGDPPPMLFLLEAQKRLLDGARLYTMMERGELVHRAWLAPRATSTAVSPGHVAYPPRAALMWDDYTRPAASHVALRELSLAQRVHDAFSVNEVDCVFLELAATDLVGREAAERLRFGYRGTARDLRRRARVPGESVASYG